MLIAGRRFAPSWFATILLLLGLAAFLSLGTWQLQRAEAKRELMERRDAGTQSTVELAAANADAVQPFQHVEAQGRYDPQRQILLDNMPSQHGQPGYRVVTPFTLNAGGRVLVDRGWVPLGATRESLPQVDVDASTRTIAGQLDELPRPGLALASPESGTVTRWPHVMHFPQHEDVESVLGSELLRGLILLDADQPDGFERAWQARLRFGPERHIGYAIQWFAFAAVALAIYLIVSLRREPIEHE